MKILVVYTPRNDVDDIAWAFIEEGHQVVQYEELVKVEQDDRQEAERIFEALKQIIIKEGIEAAYTWNYVPLVSDVCELMDIPYMSWCSDSPLVSIFSKNMYHKCNHFFIFDKKFCENLGKLQLKHLWHLPLAMNSTRLSGMEMTDAQINEYKRDITFVGNLYLENQFDEWAPDLPEHIIEKSSRMFEKQFNDWSRNTIYEDMENGFLADLKACTDISNILEVHPYIPDMIFYGGMIIMRKYAQIERICILNALAERYPVTLYTEINSPMLQNVEVKDYIDYQTKMPIAFYSSKINLNITLRSIETGVPLRVFDILGSAGFAMTNYQSELEDYFEIGKDLEAYNSVEELMDKADFYLRNEKERISILANGYKKVHAEHNYRKRVAFMLDKIK